MDSQTIMTGVMGNPIRQSLSPDMHNAVYKELGLNYASAAFAVTKENLRQAVEGIRALSFRGVNVTIPHKVAIMEYLDEIDEEASDIGAINTIVNENGKLIGYNTDGRGFVQSLLDEALCTVAEKRVLILGAGGAARAVGISLARRGASQIVVANRSVDKAAELARHISNHVPSQAISLGKLEGMDLKEIDIVINTTSIGMVPEINEMPISDKQLHSGLLVSDLIYNPIQTKLLHAAEAKGAKAHNGVGMFVQQGALALELWTGHKPPVDLMRGIVLQRLMNK